MPNYEYRCGACHQEFEDRLPMGTPDEEVVCTRCGARQATRILSQVAASSGGRAVTGTHRLCGSPFR